VRATSRHPSTPRARLAVILHSALRALRRHGLRSARHTEQQSWGGGVSLRVAVGQAAAHQIAEHIHGLGEHFLWMAAGNPNVTGVRTGTHDTQRLTLRDLEALQQQMPLLAPISPNVDLRVQGVFRDQHRATQVRGVTPPDRVVRGWRVRAGRCWG
jgi:hypothetical protein